MPHNVKVNRELDIIEVEAFGVLEEQDMLDTIAKILEISEKEGIKKNSC